MSSKLRHTSSVAALFATLLVLVWAVYAYDDQNFWTEAAQSGMAEVALGNLAQQKAQSDSVKQFAQRMVTDHTAANEELKSLASGKNVTLPADVSPKQKATYDKLNGLSGAEFDREYMKVMVKDHENAVKLFEKESKSGTDADAKAYATKTLPTLQGHLQEARSISGGSKEGSKSNGNHGSHSTNSSNSNMK